MKTPSLLMLGLLAGGLDATAFDYNFAFNSGSTAADGPLVVTTNTTLDLPASGIFNFTTINISTGATLRFNRNDANTPVYLLANGDVNIAGTIDVSGENAPGGIATVGGKGGPGGFDGGFPGFNEQSPGDGYGPGGGKAGSVSTAGCNGGAGSAGAGAYASAATGSSVCCGGFYEVGYASTNKGATYGSPLLVPLVGGSGGGGTPTRGGGGGGGGGALLIASSTRIDVSGTIRANGGEGIVTSNTCGGLDVLHLNPGSGGAIRLVAPVVAGSGVLSATGPTSGNRVYNEGRIRVDSIDRGGVFFSATPGAYIGTYMVTFPPSRLDIINVGGTNIVEGSGPVAIQFPNDSNTDRTVTVKAFNFGGMVTNIIAIIPQNGPRAFYTNVINNATRNPATNTVDVSIPPNTIVRVSAWTKVP